MEHTLVLLQRSYEAKWLLRVTSNAVMDESEVVAKRHWSGDIIAEKCSVKSWVQTVKSQVRKSSSLYFRLLHKTQLGIIKSSMKFRNTQFVKTRSSFKRWKRSNPYDVIVLFSSEGWCACFIPFWFRKILILHTNKSQEKLWSRVKTNYLSPSHVTFKCN